MSKRSKISPSHLERVKQRNRSLQDQQRLFRRLGEAAPGIHTGQPAEIIAHGNHGRAAYSLSSADFTSAIEVLRRASVPTPNVVLPDVEPNTSPQGFRQRAVSVMMRGRKKEPPMPKPEPNDNGEWDKQFPRADGWKHTKAYFVVKDLECCGMKEIHGITHVHQFYRPLDKLTFFGDPELERKYIPVSPGEVVRFAQQCLNSVWYDRNRPFLVMSDVRQALKPGQKQRGELIEKFIVENELGTVFRSEWGLNGNSGSTIQAILWTVPDRHILERFRFDPEIHLNRA